MRAWRFGLVALMLGSLPAFAADPIRIYAAGSLNGVLPAMIAASGLPEDAVAPPVFGPAGLLRQRFQGGEHADLFASADMAQPQALVGQGPALVVPFARNAMCVLAPEKLHLTQKNLLDHLLLPGVRLGASTPGADPGGDYAQAVFARADALRPGATATLKAKVLLLFGGPNSMAPQAGHSPAASIFLADRADALLYYCSGTAAAMQEVPGLVSIPVPAALEVGPVYGLGILSDRPEAARLALFMLSQRGQAMLRQAGLMPVVGGGTASR